MFCPNPAKKRKRNPNFRIEYAGDNDEHSVLANLQNIRSELTNKNNQPVGNLQVIEHLFKLWFGKRADMRRMNRRGHLHLVPTLKYNSRRMQYKKSVFFVQNNLENIIEDTTKKT